MALTVEDGTGVADADSYVAAADAATWAEAHYGASDPFVVAIEAEQERLLRLGFSYLEMEYVGRWKGVRAHEDQGGAFPRIGIVDSDGYAVPSDEVPDDIWIAQIEAARRYVSGDPMADQARGGAVKRKRVEGAVEIEWFEGAPAETTIPVIDNRLAPYLTNDGSRYVGIIERG